MLVALRVIVAITSLQQVAPRLLQVVVNATPVLHLSVATTILPALVLALIRTLFVVAMETMGAVFMLLAA
jgi:hypothetical protein